ncbi:MAG: hypothetical protein ABFC94_11920 [Syntrophomonas sp.]
MSDGTALESLEIILVNTALGKVKYAGLGGTFAALVDACLRKKALPGFYNDKLIKTAEYKDDKLVLVLAGSKTDFELLSTLDIAVRNIGAFPFDRDASRLLTVEVSCEVEI